MQQEDEVQVVGLATLKNGAAVELFDEEFRKVLENVADINTKPDAMREVTLKVKLKPSEDRALGAVEIIVTSKLAPFRPTSTTVYIGRNGQATEYNPRQPQFSFPAEKVEVS
jgi:hypothetical protein